jgi:hypothetical protein
LNGGRERERIYDTVSDTTYIWHFLKKSRVRIVPHTDDADYKLDKINDEDESVHVSIFSPINFISYTLIKAVYKKKEIAYGID